MKQTLVLMLIIKKTVFCIIGHLEYSQFKK